MCLNLIRHLLNVFVEQFFSRSERMSENAKLFGEQMKGADQVLHMQRMQPVGLPEAALQIIGWTPYRQY